MKHELTLTNNLPMHRIAFFITPHGFGHAARACAVMMALHKLHPSLEFHIYTRVPRWFFLESLGRSQWHYHEFVTDIGLIQASPIKEDLSATIAALDDFLPFSEALVERLATQVVAQGCRLLVCDIAPLGLVVAQRAGLPSALLENFTWDWIYQGYVDAEPRLAQHITYLARVFQLADLHIQTEPVCVRRSVDLTTPPVSRLPRHSATDTRAALGASLDKPLILISFGGVPQQGFPELQKFHEYAEYAFVVLGAVAGEMQHQHNVIMLAHHSGVYHPDLVHAADLLVGKLGVSTVAEAWQAGTAFNYIPRPGFCESAVLAEFVERELGAQPITEADYLAGTWLDSLAERLSSKHGLRPANTAADQIARLLLDKLSGRLC